MERDQVQKGLLVKVVTNYSNVPAGTWATVASTGTMKDGGWSFTVRWRPYIPIPKEFPLHVTEYSINLWESDLAKFDSDYRGRRSGFEVEARISTFIDVRPTTYITWASARSKAEPDDQSNKPERSHQQGRNHSSSRQVKSPQPVKVFWLQAADPSGLVWNYSLDCTESKRGHAGGHTNRRRKEVGIKMWIRTCNGVGEALKISPMSGD
jgi:hypothetical protein